MKVTWILGLLMAFSVPAMADSPDTMMIVEKGPGFVPIENAYNLQCEIGEKYTSVRLTRGAEWKTEYSGKDTVYTAKVKDAAQVRALVAKAEQAPLDKKPGFIDGPTRFYTGVISKEAETVIKHVRIFEDGTGVTWTNKSEGTQALVEFGNANCKEP